MNNNNFIHSSAVLIGDVTLGDSVSIWANAVLRADLNFIKIGSHSNIQDNSVLHVDSKRGLEIGEFSVIGHSVTLHSCKVGRGCLVSNGCILLEGVEVGEGSFIVAGTKIGSKRKIPPHSLVSEKNGKIIIKEQKSIVVQILAAALQYVKLAERVRRKYFGPFKYDELKQFDIDAINLAKKLGLK